MKAIAYLRVSTDDRGQRPERQLRIIESYAGANPVAIVGVAQDEGVSGEVNPFDRPGFLRALELAVATGAQTVLCEQVDRFTRAGLLEWGWATMELERKHGLRVWYADQPWGGWAVPEEILVAGLKATMGHIWLAGHKARTRTGMAGVVGPEAGPTKSGKPVGRPKKRPREGELDLMLKLRESGASLREIAVAINSRRGIHTMKTAQARRKHAVTHAWVADCLSENADCQKMVSLQEGV